VVCFVLFQEICLYIFSLHKMMGCVMDFFFLPLLKKENFKVNDEMKNCEGFLCNGLCIKIRIFWGGDGGEIVCFLMGEESEDLFFVWL